MERVFHFNPSASVDGCRTSAMLDDISHFDGCKMLLDKSQMYFICSGTKIVSL
jgi:hypothetical protein